MAIAAEIDGAMLEPGFGLVLEDVWLAVSAVAAASAVATAFAGVLEGVAVEGVAVASACAAVRVWPGRTEMAVAETGGASLPSEQSSEGYESTTRSWPKGHTPFTKQEAARAVRGDAWNADTSTSRWYGPTGRDGMKLGCYDSAQNDCG